MNGLGHYFDVLIEIVTYRGLIHILDVRVNEDINQILNTFSRYDVTKLVARDKATDICYKYSTVW